eukprot:9447660-Ditylum_brightwellii.AAC.1
MINYYCDMWQGCSKVLVVLTALTSKTTLWKWTSTKQEAFEWVEKIVSQETLLVYPDFNILFGMHMDASDTLLGIAISEH